MEDQFFTLKEVYLNNHCPECYSREGLHLTFKQKFIEAKLYKAVTSYTEHSLSCSKCNTSIFPVRWTDDIEQVVDYHIRARSPKPKSIKLKKWLGFLFASLLL
ncbi:hypothetical protein OE09_0253 [Flavobacteriaceae bacterium MAR_2010_72]|nr:hypothetical protein OE09_0253 [Flavobacteriaceae bacterium MAR_2010_72]TVZ58046.1 hypothetical protein NA63_0539 [Flavobacteriaceae bacterium MAR_2010_105]